MTTRVTQVPVDTSLTVAQKYRAAISRAKVIAQRDDCEVYVAAVLGLHNGAPIITGFNVVDFYDSACMMRVSATVTHEI